MIRCRGTLFALAMSLGLAAAVGGQGESEATPTGTFGETVEVRVVNVDVYVTDRRGNPVTGLGPEDFRLYDDGRRVEITNFYAVAGGEPVASITRPVGSSSDVTPVESQPGEPSREDATTGSHEPLPESSETTIPPKRREVEAQAESERQKLQLVVYIDNVNIAPLSRNRVFRALREFLYENVQPGDRVMLLSYDRTLHVRQPFTADPQTVGRALLELETVSGQTSSNVAQRQELMRQIEDADTVGQVSGRVRQHARSIQNDLRFTLDAMRESVRSLAGLPGRKILLYVSDGLPMSPGKDLFSALQYRFDDRTALATATEFNQGRAFRELTNLANANRVAFYTVDAKGLTMPEGYAAEYRGGSYESDWRSQVASLEQDNLQDSIRMMAARTGGLAIVNTNDIGPGLRRLAQDVDSYYSLGFRPIVAGNDRYHEIKVEVMRKGVTVRHREGYRDKSIATRMAESVEANLRYGTGENPMQVRVDLGAATPRESDEFVVPVSVKIPLDRLTLIPREDVWVGRALVFFGTMNANGELSDVSTGQVDVRIPSADYETAVRQVWSFDAQLLVRPGRQRLAVGVQDQLGAQSSLVGRTFDVGS